jgi:hypothetical protein
MLVGIRDQNGKTIVVPARIVVFGDTPDQPPEIGRFVAGKTLPF